MKTFLDDIAQQLIQTGGNDFSGYCIVVPNRRAGVFLRNAISRYTSGAIWAPTILSIEDFVFGLSSYTKADQTTLLFTFYDVYSKVANEPQTIELFASWAPIFLSDINEIDLNLLPTEKVFQELYSIERIKKWNPASGEATDFQKKHLKFVENFYSFYTQLTETLMSKKIGYQGMAFREVAENIQAVVSKTKWSSIWFAGFNALTTSEEKMLAAWQQSGKAKLFWDVDSHYANNPLHEAGFYIRKYAKGKSAFKIDEDYKWQNAFLNSEEKELYIIAAQRNITQAKIAGTILQERVDAGKKQLSKTAVVLNDEQLLIPLLSALPTQLSDVNVTMGYGIKHSQSAIFIQHIFNLYSKFASSNFRFHHSLVSALENDPFYQMVGGGEKLTSSKESKAYYDYSDLQVSELCKLLFNEKNTTVDGFLAGLQFIIVEVGKSLDENEDKLEREFLYLLEKLTQRLVDLSQEFGTIDSIKTLQTFWNQLLNQLQLDFVGEPLTGLQVMGMLETRNLDFEEVIMLGVNEGNLPSTSHASSYFTFDIRKAYGLACQNERDAVTAYHFYRLLQRAKRVYLVYDQDTDSLGGGEVSRYVKQLRIEAPFYRKENELNVNQLFPKAGVGAQISVSKGDKEFDKLLFRAQDKGFSPSALNTFRTCSLKYYFRYIADVSEPAVFQEDIDAAKLGSAIHETLEELYKPFIGQVLKVDDLKKLKSRIKDVLVLKFQDQLETSEPLSGANLLSFEVAKNYVNKVIDNDITSSENGSVTTIVGLEMDLLKEVNVEANDETVKVKLSGSADRVDRTNDVTRIIDYKTGKFDKTFKIKSLESFDDPRTDNAFQMLMYGYVASDVLQTSNIKPEGFYLRSQDIQKPIEVKTDAVLEGAKLLGFAEKAIQSTLKKLLDKSEKFTQTEDEKRCVYCDFAGVCQRG